MNASVELAKLYKKIHACTDCQPNVYESLVIREVIPQTCNSEIAFMAQAPGENGIRKSGIHWVQDDREKLTRGGGRFLTNRLEEIGYTIDPFNKNYPRPYTTNVLQCWTGKNKSDGRDRPPDLRELERCKRWWQSELRIVRPKALVMLGKPASESFALISGIGSFELVELMEHHQGTELNFGSIDLKCFFVPHPTSSYVHPKSGIKKTEIYRDVFNQMVQIL